MKIKRGIKITIQEPCSEKWDNLTLVETGRFCSTCQKTVVDFRQMSDYELLNYFKKYQGNVQGNVCGNFNPIQTDRIISLYETKGKSNRFSKFIASLIGLFLSFGAKAQTTDTTKTKNVIEISPLSTVKSTVIKSDQPITKCEIKNPETLLQGKLGGVCIEGIEIRSEDTFKNKFFTRIEDMLRNL